MTKDDGMVAAAEALTGELFHIDKDEQLNLSKTKSNGLKVTVQGLESKNTGCASELENLMSSLQVVELNGALQAPVNQISTANDNLSEVNYIKEEQISQLLDINESLTRNLNDERSSHERELEKMKNMADVEK
jgi:hypothetical protein